MNPRSQQPPADWQALDAGSMWMKEFALALTQLAPTISWAPSIENLGHWQNWEREEWAAEPGLTLTRFPRQRFSDGYETERWLASQAGTWENRARTIVQALNERSELWAAAAN